MPARRIRALTPGTPTIDDDTFMAIDRIGDVEATKVALIDLVTVIVAASDYTHNQITPALVWNIIHNLARFPSVTVVDSGGTEVIGDVKYISNNQVDVTFTSAFGGKAYLT